MINGATDLIMMKADVMDQFEKIKICTSYSIAGELTEDFPNEIDEQVVPVYQELEGWKTDLTGVDHVSKFPSALSNYIKFIEDYLKVPITIVSVGPNRSQTIER
jgi:adenylosuccinate synthase